jgi:acetylornithine/succinyldiaminopimelate/putrescine aminotransferase
MNDNASELKLIESICEDALRTTIRDFADYSGLILNKAAAKVLDAEFRLLKQSFQTSLLQAHELAQHSLADRDTFAPERLSSINPSVSPVLETIRNEFPQASNMWVLNGLLFQSQRAGLKTLTGCPSESANILDVLSSASSIALGAENPWLLYADRLEDHLGIRDNFCTTYHVGIRQGFAMRELLKQYPGKAPDDQTVIHMESSGTIAASVAIESVVSYVEKRDNKHTKLRVLAVDGSWAGGYGTAREATGFGANNEQAQRTTGAIWVDRCLPPPDSRTGQQFLSILKQKLKSGTVAGLYIEPDILGDLGIVATDSAILQQARQLMEARKLPIILDCVQQLGRSGGYWGAHVTTIFKDYPLLVVLTAKSASNGQAFGYTLLPKVIADAAQPLSQITTNQMNGPLLRVVVATRILNDDRLQDWLKRKSDAIDRFMTSSTGENLHIKLRGKLLNRGFELADNNLVKLAQLALLIHDGILVGATPNSLRYQPQLLEFSTTNQLIVELIARRVDDVQHDRVSRDLLRLYDSLDGATSGLARSNLSLITTV